jgi:hypothetical protein
MRLFGKVDGVVDRYDRAGWLTMPFDRAWAAPVAPVFTAPDPLRAVSTRLGPDPSRARSARTGPDPLRAASSRIGPDPTKSVSTRV